MAPDELGPAPKTRERAITSVHRVLGWKCDLEDRREGAIVVGRAGAAFVVTAEGRVCADHQQVLAGGQSLVTGSGRQDRHIAGLEVKRFSVFAAEANPGIAARDPEHFVSARVIVHVTVNAVAPGIAPAVTRKQLFKYLRWIKVVREADRAAVEDERQFSDCFGTT